jgi:hypothetical protein
MIECDNYNYEIPDKLMHNKIMPEEGKELFKWILCLYIDNYLKYSSLDSINNKIMNTYTLKAEGLVSIIYHNLPLDTIQYDTLDKQIYNKIPKNIMTSGMSLNKDIFETQSQQ